MGWEAKIGVRSSLYGRRCGSVVSVDITVTQSWKRVKHINRLAVDSTFTTVGPKDEHILFVNLCINSTLVMSSARRHDLAEEGRPVTDEDRKFQKPFQTVDKPPVTDNLNDQYYRDPPKVSMNGCQCR